MAGIRDDIPKGSAAVFAPITVQQYHDMISAGILLEGAPVELIDGLLVQKDRTCVAYHPGDEIAFQLPGREVRVTVSELLG